jgi:hypothetical protein
MAGSAASSAGSERRRAKLTEQGAAMRDLGIHLDGNSGEEATIGAVE